MARQTKAQKEAALALQNESQETPIETVKDNSPVNQLPNESPDLTGQPGTPGDSSPANSDAGSSADGGDGTESTDEGSNQPSSAGSGSAGEGMDSDDSGSGGVSNADESEPEDSDGSGSDPDFGSPNDPDADDQPGEEEAPLATDPMAGLIDRRRTLLEEFNRAAYDSEEYRSRAKDIVDLEEEIDALELAQAGNQTPSEADQKAARIRKRAMGQWIGLQVESLFRASQSEPGLKYNRREK